MRASSPRAIRLCCSVTAASRVSYAATCTVYFVGPFGVRGTTVVVVTVVVTVFFEVVAAFAGAAAGGGRGSVSRAGALGGADATTVGGATVGVLSTIVVATAAVSLPWQRCIQKSI